LYSFPTRRSSDLKELKKLLPYLPFSERGFVQPFYVCHQPIPEAHDRCIYFLTALEWLLRGDSSCNRACTFQDEPEGNVLSAPGWLRRLRSVEAFQDTRACWNSPASGCLIRRDYSYNLCIFITHFPGVFA